MRIYLLFLFSFLLSNDVSGQINGYFGEIGASYFQVSDNGPSRQLAVRNSVGLLLGRRWAVGMKIQQVCYQHANAGSQYMNLWGPFGRWGIRIGRVYIYLESGIHWGNYSAVGGPFTGNIYKEAGLVYISFGAAMEARITGGISAKLGLITHEIINRPPPQYGFDSYVVGLVFDLKKGE